MQVVRHNNKSNKVKLIIFPAKIKNGYHYLSIFWVNEKRVVVDCFCSDKGWIMTQIQSFNVSHNVINSENPRQDASAIFLMSVSSGKMLTSLFYQSLRARPERSEGTVRGNPT